MYAETEFMYPYFLNFPQEVEQLHELCSFQKPNALMTMISEYDLGAEGDLFKAPEPIPEEPTLAIDPMAAAMSMISCGDDIISPQSLKVSDIESSFETGQLLSEVYYECKKDLMANEANADPLSEILDIKVPVIKTDGNLADVGNLLPEVSIPKSISSNCLSSMEWVNEAPARPTNFLDFSATDFGSVFKMRRAFSEGDIETLGNDNVSLIHSQMQAFSSCTSDDRQEKLSRYRSKRARRNFGRKIKYACRKALADSQPRIRGRFAKTEDINSSKRR